jgi:hypothetical protein
LTAKTAANPKAIRIVNVVPALASLATFTDGSLVAAKKPVC